MKYRPSGGHDESGIPAFRLPLGTLVDIGGVEGAVPVLTIHTNVARAGTSRRRGQGTQGCGGLTIGSCGQDMGSREVDDRVIEGSSPAPVNAGETPLIATVSSLAAA